MITATPSWAAPPANDDVANAQAETGSFTDSFNNADATTESGEPLPSSCASGFSIDKRSGTA